MTERCLFAYPN